MSSPSKCPCNTKSDAAVLLVKLKTKHMIKYIAAHKKDSIFRAFMSQQEKYDAILTDYFLTYPLIKKLVLQTHYGRGGDYRPLINRLIKHGA
jgi:hypothetical protein